MQQKTLTIATTTEDVRPHYYQTDPELQKLLDDGWKITSISSTSSTALRAGYHFATRLYLTFLLQKES